jgi:hypothetical protein
MRIILTIALLLGLLASVATQAEDTREPIVARTNQPLDLLLTQAELRSIIHNYEARTGDVVTMPIDEEVLVTAPGEYAPMRELSRDVPRGLASPFWAIANPSQSWRIFMPIPPKGLPRDEPPLPDPR